MKAMINKKPWGESLRRKGGLVLAERRMFAKTIIDSDAFLDMPLSAQALYFHLSMRADDDGFVNNPRKVQRLINASDDDLRLLIAKSFLIPFETGIVVIKHWKIHNYIRGDRKHDTKYQEEMSMLSVKENGAYTLCQSNVSQLTDNCPTEVRLGKDSIGKVRLGKDSINSSEPLEVSEQEKEIKYADVAAIPLNDGTEWLMPLELYDEYCKTYPALDIKQELKQMRVWSLSNPTKKKTKRGITRFVNTWLDNSQNNSRNRRPSTSQGTDWSKIH